MVVFKNKQDQDKKEFEAHKKELEQARDFQLSLIPDSPPNDIPYDVHSYMKTSMEVGGDYYDYFKNDKDLLIRKPLIQAIVPIIIPYLIL